MMINQIKRAISRVTIDAFRAGLIGDKTLEQEISHEILMVLQSRQHGDQTSLPVEFDICTTRLDVFRAIAGRDAK